MCISGGSGSGKTTVAHQLASMMPPNIKTGILYQDNYYRDQSNLPFAKRVAINYDHPSAFDWERMRKDLNDLLNKRPIDAPVYDFKEHTRSKATEHKEPVDVLIFEGFMALHDEKIAADAAIKIFVDTPSDERLTRRLIRDINERKRSPESIALQWRNNVRPMYRAYVAPQKELADIIIPWYNINPVALCAIKGSVVDFMNERNGQSAPAAKPAGVGLADMKYGEDATLVMTQPVANHRHARRPNAPDQEQTAVDAAPQPVRQAAPQETGQASRPLSEQMQNPNESRRSQSSPNARRQNFFNQKQAPAPTAAAPRPAADQAAKPNEGARARSPEPQKQGPGESHRNAPHARRPAALPKDEAAKTPVGPSRQPRTAPSGPGSRSKPQQFQNQQRRDPNATLRPQGRPAQQTAAPVQKAAVVHRNQMRPPEFKNHPAKNPDPPKK